MDGAELEWACGKCPKKPEEDIHPYTHKLLQIKALKDAGFPLESDFLEYEEWVDLGRINQKIAAYEQSNMMKGTMGMFFGGSQSNQ